MMPNSLMVEWRRIKHESRYLLTSSLLVVVYVVAAKWGLSFAEPIKQVTLIWPAPAIALVALLMLGRRYWPSIFIGAFITNMLTQETVPVALGIAVGNTLEAIVGAYLLRRYTNYKYVLKGPQDAAIFGGAAVVSTLIASIIGPLCLCVGGIVPRHYWMLAARQWWEGDLMGVLVVAPFLLVYLNPASYRVLRHRHVEWGLLLAITYGASVLVFTSPRYSFLAHPYLLFLLLALAAIRFLQLGAVTCSLLVAAVGLWATLSGLGPFAVLGSGEPSIFELELFVCVLSGSSLVMGMAISERYHAEQELRGQTQKLERLESDLRDANRRVTSILEGILDNGSSRHRNHDD